MADANRAIAWLLSQSGFKLAIENAEWIDELLPGWTDICCKLSIDGKEVVTWGAAPSSDMALLKAFSEGVERAVFLSEGSETSNGFAAHLSRPDARANALNELVERDLFLCHFLTNTPFVPLLEQDWGGDSLANVLSFSRKFDLHVRYFRLGKTGVLCIADGLCSQNKSGFVVGGSYKDNINESFLSATIETLRQVYFNDKLRQSGKLRVLSLKEFLMIPDPDFADHGALALDIEYARMIAHLFGSASAESAISEIDLSKVSFVDLKWMTDSTCPFYIAKATSEQAQKMFLGRPNESVLNRPRLQAVSNGRSFNLLPHPFN